MHCCLLESCSSSIYFAGWSVGTLRPAPTVCTCGILSCIVLLSCRADWPDATSIPSCCTPGRYHECTPYTCI